MNDSEIRYLIKQVALRDHEDSFRQLFLFYYPQLVSFSNSFVKCTEIAEEIAEDVFLSIWNKRALLTGIKNFRVYLYVATKNASLNHLKQARYFNAYDLNQLDVVCISSNNTPENLFIASEMLRAIDKAIAELPPKCRIIYKLVREEGFRYKEAAKILNISPRTVENHIAAAVRKIAAAINMDFRTTQAVQTKPSGNG